MTCPARTGGTGSDEARRFQKWIEGNDEVRVLGAWGNHRSHKIFAIIEASGFAAVSALLCEPMLADKTEVLRVNDDIVMKKERGHWES